MCTSRSTFAHTVTPAGVPVPVRKGPVIIIIIISFLCGVFAFGFPKLYAVVTLSIHNCQFRNRDVICDLCGAQARNMLLKKMNGDSPCLSLTSCLESRNENTQRTATQHTNPVHGCLNKVFIQGQARKNNQQLCQD